MKRIIVIIISFCAFLCTFSQVNRNKHNSKKPHYPTSRKMPSLVNKAKNNKDSLENDILNPAIIDFIPGSLKIIDANKNGIIDANESGFLMFQITNTGMSTATGCSVLTEISGTKDGISIGKCNIPSIKVGEAITLSIPFHSDVNTKNGSVAFFVKIDEPNGFGTDYIMASTKTHAFDAPIVRAWYHQINSDKGQTLQKKVPFCLQLQVKNYSPNPAEKVKVSIEMPQQVYLLGDSKKTIVIERLNGYESEILSFNLITSNNYIQTDIPITIHITERYAKNPEDKKIRLTFGESLTNPNLHKPQKYEADISAHNVEGQLGVLVSDIKPQEAPKPVAVVEQKVLVETPKPGEDNNNKVFTSVEQMPQFPGGDAALMKHIASHLQYPPIAQDLGIQGKCIIQFVVTKTGDVGEMRVVRSLSPDCDNEAKRVIKGLPKFTPGKQSGQYINVWYTLPITFKLQDDYAIPMCGNGLEKLNVIKWKKPLVITSGKIIVHAKINSDGKVEEVIAKSGHGPVWQDEKSIALCEIATMLCTFQPTGKTEEGEIIWNY